MTEERILLFGGTFNPIHNGHLAMADAALRQFPGSRLLLIPTAVPPHKPGDGLASSEHRMEMCRLAIADHPCINLSDIEVRRGGLSYTVQTVRALAKEFPGAEFVFLCGEDMFLTLAQWREWRWLCEHLAFAVASRPGAAHLLAGALRDFAALGGRAELLDWSPKQVSSTEIRRRAASGESIEVLVPPAVNSYISQHHLYI